MEISITGKVVACGEMGDAVPCVVPGNVKKSGVGHIFQHIGEFGYSHLLYGHATHTILVWLHESCKSHGSHSRIRCFLQWIP